jgi:hypothetical protein
MNMLIIFTSNDVITMLETFLCNSQKAVCYLYMQSGLFSLMFSYEGPHSEPLRTIKNTGGLVKSVAGILPVLSLPNS